MWDVVLKTLSNDINVSVRMYQNIWKNQMACMCCIKTWEKRRLSVLKGLSEKIQGVTLYQ